MQVIHPAVFRPFSLFFGARSANSFSNLPPVSLNKSRIFRGTLRDVVNFLHCLKLMASSKFLNTEMLLEHMMK